MGAGIGTPNSPSYAQGGTGGGQAFPGFGQGPGQLQYMPDPGMAFGGGFGQPGGFGGGGGFGQPGGFGGGFGQPAGVPQFASQGGFGGGYPQQFAQPQQLQYTSPQQYSPQPYPEPQGGLTRPGGSEAFPGFGQGPGQLQFMPDVAGQQAGGFVTPQQTQGGGSTLQNMLGGQSLPARPTPRQGGGSAGGAGGGARTRKTPKAPIAKARPIVRKPARG